MDVDIDLPTSFDPLNYFPEVVRASMVQGGKLKKHNAGVYFQNMARDQISGFAAVPYKQAEELGYMKIDFLHLSFLDIFESKDEIRVLLKKEPDWFLLQSAGVVQRLSHVHKHYDVVSRVQPTTVQELADAIAIIRPAKRHLLDAYVKNREVIRPELYRKPDDGKYYFKKGHAVAYALTIVLQLHLIKAGIL